MADSERSVPAPSDATPAVLPSQHGPAWDATGDTALTEQVGAALAATGLGELLLTPSAGSETISARVVAEGRLFDAPAAVSVAGAPNSCHENVAAYAAGVSLLPEDVVAPLAHWWGWALSDDGMWREHSWGVDGEGTVVETTVHRSAYFGVELSAAERELVAPAVSFGVPDSESFMKVHVEFGPESPFGDPGFSGESLWATPVGHDDLFRVENVPFFAEGFTIGSVVAARRVGGGWEVTSVVSHSFAGTGGVALAESLDSEALLGAAEALRSMGCVLERAMENLFSFAAPAGVDAAAIERVLGPLDCEWWLEPLAEPSGATVGV